MSELQYLEESQVTAAKRTKTPINRTVSGYGSKLPTQYMIQVDGRWYRVYCICYSNSGSTYIQSKGQMLFCTRVEFKIKELAE